MRLGIAAQLLTASRCGPNAYDCWHPEVRRERGAGMKANFFLRGPFRAHLARASDVVFADETSSLRKYFRGDCAEKRKLE